MIDVLENMVITAQGHLKFIDFGTAKDFFQTDLNGIYIL